VTKTEALPKRHSATTEDKFEEEESEEERKIKAKTKSKSKKTDLGSKQRLILPEPLPQPSQSLSNDPMEIEMDIAAEFKKFEKELRALVAADLKKAYLLRSLCPSPFSVPKSFVGKR